MASKRTLLSKKLAEMPMLMVPMSVPQLHESVTLEDWGSIKGNMDCNLGAAVGGRYCGHWNVYLLYALHHLIFTIYFLVVHGA